MELEERARDSADNCIACTSCIAACPVTKANPEYKGPKLVGPAHSRMHFSDPSDYEDTLMLCSNCKNCDITCPCICFYFEYVGERQISEGTSRGS